MRFTYILLLFSIVTFSQSKVLNVTINAINSKEIKINRKQYIINYQIENLTNQEVSFFLKPNYLIANAVSSMTLYPIYKLYVNNELSLLDGPFFGKYSFFWDEFRDKYKNASKVEFNSLVTKILKDNQVIDIEIIENYKNKGGTNTDENWILENNNLMKSKITLKPKEVKSFEIQTDWNRERYFKEDDLEYYLNENDQYEFELTLDLKKTAFENQLSKEEFMTIERDKNFIQGIFTSNKVIIDFK